MPFVRLYRKLILSLTALQVVIYPLDSTSALLLGKTYHDDELYASLVDVL